MRNARQRLLLLAALLGTACSDPTDMKGWAERAASRNRLDEKLSALASARTAPGDKRAAVAPLCEVLKQTPRARQQAAVILGEIGEAGAAEAVPALVGAIDGSGKADREVNDANVAIAAALGALRARQAVPALARLARSGDAFTQVAAIDALGAVGDAAAVEPLLATVDDERAEPFAVKKALLALGRIGDARAVPTVVRMLFTERPGVTFFPEAAFAASQLGGAMSAPLVAVVEGRDAALAAWAASHDVHPAALRAKAAQLLGDVGGPEAVPALVGALGYVGDGAEGRLFVRAFAAESLGRLHASEAVAPLATALAKEQDPDLRERYLDALSRIGDPAALPALRAAAGSGPAGQREAALKALSRLGDASDRAQVEAARRACGPGCPPARARALEGMLARLDAAKACAGAVACWTGKLADPRAEVRDRAALEVGSAGGAAQVDALSAAITRPVESDADLEARFHAVLALELIVRRQPLGAKGLEVAAALDRLLVADKGRALTGAVDEDALRLAARLRRGAR